MHSYTTGITDAPTKLVWDIGVKGGVGFANPASAPIPSVFGLDMKLEVEFGVTVAPADFSYLNPTRSKVSAASGLDKCAERYAGGGAAAKGAGCGGGNNYKVCDVGLACIDGACSAIASSEYGNKGQRAVAEGKVVEAYSYNKGYACSKVGICNRNRLL